jgi:hypothetical protein
MAYLLDERNEPILDFYGNPIGDGEESTTVSAVDEALLEPGSEILYLLETVHSMTSALRAKADSVPALDLLSVARAIVEGNPNGTSSVLG